MRLAVMHKVVNIIGQECFLPCLPMEEEREMN